MDVIDELFGKNWRLGAWNQYCLEEVEQRLKENGFKVFYLNLPETLEEHQLAQMFQDFLTPLGYPGPYYPLNWDALSDDLFNALSDYPANRIVIGLLNADYWVKNHFRSLLNLLEIVIHVRGAMMDVPFSMGGPTELRMILFGYSEIFPKVAPMAD